MSAILGRVTGRASQRAIRTQFRTAISDAQKTAEAVKENISVKDNVLKKGAKRDPELYVLFAIMTGAFGLAGYYFGTKPTSSTSETVTSMSYDTMPWKLPASEISTDEPNFKYKYYPNGDKTKPLKSAPSALHATIYPPISQRKSVHDQYNRYGKDDWP